MISFNGDIIGDTFNKNFENWKSYKKINNRVSIMFKIINSCNNPDYY